MKYSRFEVPQHTVTVPTFFMGKYEVTQAQWRAVARLPRLNRDLVSDPSNFKGDSLPVEQVSWEDAIEFCARLSRATGRAYRLPTESEWEYACRGGMTTTFYFGDTITPELVNYNGNYPYGSAAKGTHRETTTAAGSVGYPNAFGLYDMHGNVCEGCMDHCTKATMERRRMGVRGRAEATRASGCCAAGLGTALPAAAALPLATGTPRPIAATTSGFAL